MSVIPARSGSISNGDKVGRQASRNTFTQLMTRCDFLQRWSTEYCIYAAIVAVSAVYFLLYDLAVVSRDNYNDLKDSISKPWMVFRILGSRGFDNSDSQWGAFIASLPLVILFLFFFLFVSYVMRHPTVNSLREKNLYGKLLGHAAAPTVNATNAGVFDQPDCIAKSYVGSPACALNNSSRSGLRVDDSSSNSSSSNHDSHVVRMMSRISGAQQAPGNATDAGLGRRSRTGHYNVHDDHNGDDSIISNSTHYHRGKCNNTIPMSAALRASSPALSSRVVLSNPVASPQTEQSQSSDAHTSYSAQSTVDELATVHAITRNHPDVAVDSADFIAAVSSTQQDESDLSCAQQRRFHWMHFASGLILSFALSSSGAFFGLVLMCINYYFIAMLQRRYNVPVHVCMAVMWVWHVVMLFVNFKCDGYRFAYFGLGFLDNLWSPETRWIVQYNMSVLRMIAFNTDFWEASTRRPEQRLKMIETHARSCLDCAVIREANANFDNPAAESLRCYKCRSACPHNAGNAISGLRDSSSHVDRDCIELTSNTSENTKKMGSYQQHFRNGTNLGTLMTTTSVGEYNLIAYLGYLYYPPLFVAGPMLSFNAYVSYIKFPTRSMTTKGIWLYGINFVVSTLTLLIFTHYVYISALILPRAQTGIGSRTAVDAAVAGGHLASESIDLRSVVETLQFPRRIAILFMSLAFLWLKFNSVWKFFRFIALLDGIDTPEDMSRIFINTTNIQTFWRNWHASFNVWIVRYMYIPLGGSKNKLLSIIPIFLFIAVWHDIELRLIFWALSMLVFLVPELIVTSFISRTKNPFITRIKKHRRAWQYIRATGTTISVLELMLINLIGFSIGEKGALYELKKMYSEVTWLCFFTIVFHFMLAAVLSIQDYDEERYTVQQLRLKYNLPNR